MHAHVPISWGNLLARPQHSISSVVTYVAGALECLRLPTRRSRSITPRECTCAHDFEHGVLWHVSGQHWTAFAMTGWLWVCGGAHGYCYDAGTPGRQSSHGCKSKSCSASVPLSDVRAHVQSLHGARCHLWVVAGVRSFSGLDGLRSATCSRGTVARRQHVSAPNWLRSALLSR